ncbi:MAG TPA: hypothetical protein PJ984_01430 [Candidatus Saccharibacteria bacterium]|nr:hypothetical protein [Candidatus Saccharibacteria bacterium]
MKKTKTLSSVFFVVLAALILFGSHQAIAASSSDWRAGNIIDDNLFYSGNDMSAGEIQAFLNSKVPVCDTWGTKTSEFGGGTRAQYGASQGYPAPYTCLKDYSQSIPGYSADAYCGAIGAGAKSAAQIIKDVSQACGVGSRVLLVLLQKEQSLITDEWPWSNQYQKATGFACPDTAPCDSQYAGYFNQVYRAARQYKVYRANPNSYRYKARQNNAVQFNPSIGCGSSNVYIENDATAGLYIYTPYQPNQAALNNLYGSGDGCSAYGNRNFWRMYTDWFGTTRSSVAPFAWTYLNQEAFSDPSRTKKLTGTATTTPGGKIYIRIYARNSGYMTWEKNFMRVGTSRPNDSISKFYDTSWLAPQRPASMNEQTVLPGENATFDFTISTPLTPGSYREYFNLVADGKTWLNDPGLQQPINAVVSASPSVTNSRLDPGMTLNIGSYLLSSDRQSLLYLQKDGNLVIYSNFMPTWSTNTSGSGATKLVMQHDGNLVLYTASMKPVWASGTDGNPGTYFVIQTDGNLVLYRTSGLPAWVSYTIGNPDGLSYINTHLRTGLSALQPGQWLGSADRQYQLIMQHDGNLVLYTASMKPVWASGTDGNPGAFALMQPDGNFVVYSGKLTPLWSTRTYGSQSNAIYVQQDGNLVLYTADMIAKWSIK